ncbi:sugar transferase [Mediterraneibacter gnavus]|uniref:sugar transferase n=1 Tax=Mediterraneibacter gnavus TaxID=33038 RepID=UPI0035621EC0
MSIDKKKIGNIIKIAVIGTGTAFIGLNIIAKKKKEDSVFEKEMEQKNPLEGKKVIFVEDENDEENADGVRGHLEAVGETKKSKGIYDRYVKRAIDIVLSFGGLVLLSPVYTAIAIAIKIDDPGPVLFTQKRVGQNKEFFKIHKFRSMKMSTPHDVPTHMLGDPDQYITRVGKFLRKHSLDELPQIWDIFIGNMSVIGPRPALWNQDVLIAEREKYNANDVKPGLTGWAQINGRDELEIPVKAKLDGEYVEKESLLFDIKCFLGTVGKVAKDDSVVEGGTGEIKKVSKIVAQENLKVIGNKKDVDLKKTENIAERKILITGANSYIGESVERWLQDSGHNYRITTLDMLDPDWKEHEFSKYDVVFHVAGIAHAEVGRVSDEIRNKYYKVNRDLAIEVASIAKDQGVKQFIFMSSMIIYNGCEESFITKDTKPKAENFYGDSKLQADLKLQKLNCNDFKVCIIRPPMIYGKGSKGNYPILVKLATKLPVFPVVKNRRSMLHIDNLCEFIKLMIDNEEGGIFFPQNDEYTNTSCMVKMIANAKGHKIIMLPGTNWIIKLMIRVPGKIGTLANKAFGNQVYDMILSYYDKGDYRVRSLSESIRISEGE